MTRICINLAFASAIASSAAAQSFNIDFGDPGSGPSAGYAAAGRAGVWNTFGVLPPYQNTPLVNILGNPTSAYIYIYGATDMLAADNAATFGDDQALIDDMLLSYNDPTDACIWLANLAAGNYEVLIYAITPDDAARLCRVRVDFGSPGPVMVGGAWPGQHQQGVTFARHTVAISAGGTIGLHSGLAGAYIQSGLNGLQVRRIIDCAGDVNDDDRCDLSDLATLLSHFGMTAGAMRGDGDFDDDGDVDLGDLATLLSAFGGVCQ